MNVIELPDNEDCIYKSNDKIRLDLSFMANTDLNGLRFGVIPFYKGDAPVGASFSEELPNVKAGEEIKKSFIFDTSSLAEGTYTLSLTLLQHDDAGNPIIADRVDRACGIEIKKNEADGKNMNWDHRSFGSTHLSALKLI